SEGVIEVILQALKNYGSQSCAYLISDIKNFIPTDEDIAKILKILNGLNPQKDENSRNLYYHLKNSLFNFPFEILQKNYDAIAFNKEILTGYNILKNRKEVTSRSPDVLWNDLENLCLEYKGKNELEKEDSQYIILYTEGLTNYKNEIKHKIIMSLSQKTENYHFEECLVELAGELKIKEVIPYLFRIYFDTDFMHLVNSKCINSLGKIGTIEVVNEVEKYFKLNNNIDDDHKDRFADILKYIPFEYAENLAIELLKKEKDTSVRTTLAGALCDIFSLKGTDLVAAMIKNQEYDSSIMELYEYLFPVYIYHEQKITEELLNIEKEDKIFIQKKKEGDPLYMMGQEFRNNILGPDLSTDSKKESLQKKSNVVSLNVAKSKRKSSRRNKR
ncbi:MAG: hypothetical protein ABUK01_09380, partial [Leptospirales bacterium]